MRWHAIIKNFEKHYPKIYATNTINLDFHGISHSGDKANMEKVWCGSKNKTLKGANTFFAQEGNSNNLLYANDEIKRSDASK